MDERPQQIDYNMIVMNHLNRLSYLTTSSFIDAVSKEMSDKYVNPLSVGDTALEWGVQFLFCLIPDDLIDKKYELDRNKYLNETNITFMNFMKLRALVNLLNRKGLLLSKDRFAFKNLKEQKTIIEEDFEK